MSPSTSNFSSTTVHTSVSYFTATELQHTTSASSEGHAFKRSTEEIESNPPTEDISDEVIQAYCIAHSQVPDGGYGWVVVIACAIISWWFVGTCYTWGIYQAALIERNLSSPSTLSFVGSLTFAGISFLAIVNARLIRNFGARVIAIVGIFLLGVGQILSGFSTHSVAGLYITQGVIAGVGVSLCFMVVSVRPTQYFRKKRGLANGIVCAGGGLGATVISLIIDILVENLSPEWAFWILGFATLVTGLPAAYLIRERAPTRPTAFVE
ncbi:hypothetical protein AJ79_04223 [Helicocarpus griseus UAMH5409]|uniref:Major facilitator superfamily (MFS) profile domain-containing protein n=1 Tax=Helicocarpus griseus UAMH5409 TaxID=1447875 RepID=A0A2B7XU40_9EURO|nr:hypothetical protein AJ79_04223 [Helicocarpus griseus UAMH5409]